MMRFTATVAFALLATAAIAVDLPKWSAELWATEEGEELVAAVTAWEQSGEDFPPSIALLCGGRNSLNLRYDPGAEAHADAEWTGRTAQVSFSVGDKTRAYELIFEEEDSMFAVSLPGDDPLLANFRAGKDVTISAAGFPNQTFSLAGASAAISDVQRSCR